MIKFHQLNRHLPASQKVTNHFSDSFGFCTCHKVDNPCGAYETVTTKCTQTHQSVACAHWAVWDFFFGNLRLLSIDWRQLVGIFWRTLFKSQDDLQMLTGHICLSDIFIAHISTILIDGQFISLIVVLYGAWISLTPQGDDDDVSCSSTASVTIHGLGPSG